MISETDANGTTATYAYGGNGRRVTKMLNGVTTTFVYDPEGQLAQDYGGPTIPLSERDTRYVMTDHLGSTRLLTKARWHSRDQRLFVVWDGIRSIRGHQSFG